MFPEDVSHSDIQLNQDGNLMLISSTMPEYKNSIYQEPKLLPKYINSIKHEGITFCSAR